MRAVKGADTSLERMVDQALRRRRWKYRRNVPELPGKPDFVFDRRRVIVFVDGDFWHGWRFPLWKSQLTAYWRKKIERNRTRDQANFRRLRRRGWTVLRFWGHQVERDLDAVIEEVETVLRAMKPRRAPAGLAPTGKK